MPAHDFNRLFSFDFEELICDLLQAEWETRLEIFMPGRDSGIDLRALPRFTAETRKENFTGRPYLTVSHQGRA